MIEAKKAEAEVVLGLAVPEDASMGDDMIGGDEFDALAVDTPE